MKFVKMQGAGNDFILLDGTKREYRDIEEMVKSLSHRKFGIGADGVMIVSRSEVADIKMDYYNSDGSIGEMCGNGIRCFSKFVYDEGIVKKEEIDIETKAGIKRAKLKIEDEKVTYVTISMGNPIWDSKKIPTLSEKEEVLEEKIVIDGKEIIFSSVLVGVPHTVIVSENLNSVDVNSLGAKIEKFSYFPKGTNVNFIEIISKDELNIKTWERGAGRTLACGTGACSSVVIAHRLGLVDKKVKVNTEGGVLDIEYNGSEIFMSGEAVTTFKGEIKWE